MGQHDHNRNYRERAGSVGSANASSARAYLGSDEVVREPWVAWTMAL